MRWRCWTRRLRLRARPDQRRAPAARRPALPTTRRCFLQPQPGRIQRAATCCLAGGAEQQKPQRCINASMRWLWTSTSPCSARNPARRALAYPQGHQLGRQAPAGPVAADGNRKLGVAAVGSNAVTCFGHHQAVRRGSDKGHFAAPVDAAQPLGLAGADAFERGVEAAAPAGRRKAAEESLQQAGVFGAHRPQRELAAIAGGEGLLLHGVDSGAGSDAATLKIDAVLGCGGVRCSGVTYSHARSHALAGYQAAGGALSRRVRPPTTAT